MNLNHPANHVLPRLSRRRRFVAGSLDFWRFCLRRLHLHNALAMSSALAFRSIFAMVPALVLALLVVKSLGILENSKDALKNFLDSAGVAQITLTGADGEINAADKILELVDGVEKKLTLGTIGQVGAALLIWTALSLMITLESSLNRICEAPQPRRWRQRLMMYWTVLTLGPLAIAVVRYIGHELGKVVADLPGIAWILTLLGWCGSALAGIILLAILYKIMPNTRVSFRAAFGGAIFVVPIWMLAKWAFKLYVLKVAGNSLYGALGALPLFLLWVNLSWTIFLLGAEISHTAANFKRIRSADQAARLTLRPADMLAVAVAIAQPFQEGRSPVTLEQIAGQIHLPDQSIHTLLERLKAMFIIHTLEDEEAYVPARPAEKIKVLDILEVSPAWLNGPSPYHADLQGPLEHLRRQADQHLGGLTLAELIRHQSPSPQTGEQT